MSLDTIAFLHSLRQVAAGNDAIGRLFTLLEDEAPGRAWIAGGAVRSHVLDGYVHTKDLDVFVHAGAMPSVHALLLRHGRLESTPFGSRRWRPAGSDVYVDVMEVESFDNGVERCASMDDVLRQFDFTANALAVDIADGAFLDPVGGQRDARARVLRAVRLDYPDEPIVPGASLTRLDVLWFRFVHYAKALDFRFERHTREWVHAQRHRGDRADAFAAVFFAVAPGAADEVLARPAAEDA